MTPPARPELTTLTSTQKELARRQLRRRRYRCEGCGGNRFIIGDALYLGFLFLRERTDSYLVALTCDQPGCAVPHSGLRCTAVQLFGAGSEPDTTETKPAGATAFAVGSLLLAVIAVRTLRQSHRHAHAHHRAGK